uniref:NADH dehydrogenase subunit 6 n=1 Tax=Marcia hiantina TaxID=676960 RepID=UPI00223774DF|nr:NADH dehydrogenase subunit 6 [Marcia hiantina]UYR95093.1 NADH dehydrogenase subunit 6 [Marcia hiantina]
MLECLFCICCLGSMNIMSRYNHPMFFGFSLLVVVVVVSMIFSFYNGVYGFMVFMCIVSGILVVFAYSVALVPLMLEKNDVNDLVSKQDGLLKSMKGGYLGWILSILSVMFCLLVALGMSFASGKVGPSWFQSALYVCADWGIAMVAFGFLLFLVMVFCVGVAGKYKGALIK